jgi:hypothetical protein
LLDCLPATELDKLRALALAKMKMNDNKIDKDKAKKTTSYLGDDVLKARNLTRDNW